MVIALGGFIFIRSCTAAGNAQLNHKFPSYLAPSLIGATILLIIDSVDFKDLPFTGWHPVPIIETSKKFIGPSVSILMPASDDRCWDSPLPCSPYFNNRLHASQQEHPITRFPIWLFIITK
jgi:hypothetical protein